MSSLTVARGVSQNRLEIRVINPIHKRELKMLRLNYITNPILPIFSKFLEKMMNKRLMLTKHVALYQNKHRSQRTESRLSFKHNEDLNKAGENFHNFFFSSLTFLIKQLDYTGLRVDWFESYIFNKQQFGHK